MIVDNDWFHFTADHKGSWFTEATKAPKRERITVQSRKMIVTIVWNPTWFHRIVTLDRISLLLL
jgi:hypothetical protein